MEDFIPYLYYYSSGSLLEDWSFEGGVPNADWAASSSLDVGIPGFPLCGPENGCPAAGIATTGSWSTWIGGISIGITSSVTQGVTIPPTATELSLQVYRGLCDDPSDTIHVNIDGNSIGSISCDVVDGGFVEYTFPLAPYNDNVPHDISIGGTVGGTNGTHSNFFVDDVYIESNLIVPAIPSQCSRMIEDLSCNVAPAGFERGIPDSWAVVDNEGTGIVWTDIYPNFVGTEGRVASVISDATPGEFDTELRSNSINLSKAKSASVNYQVDYQNFGGLDFLDLDVSIDGGTSWTTLLSWNEDHPPGGLLNSASESVSIDLSAYLGEKDVQLRWRYYDPNTGDWDWYAQVDDIAVECDVAGRMTGGGMTKQDKMKYYHGFTLRCDDDAGWNWMQIKWGKNWRDRKKFRLTELTSAVCSEQPGIDAGWPRAGFNTFEGTGVGKLNGELALIDFRITDEGEPGRSDEIRYTITGEDGVTVSGKLRWGNHQAHKVWYKH